MFAYRVEEEEKQIWTYRSDYLKQKEKKGEGPFSDKKLEEKKRKIINRLM